MRLTVFDVGQGTAVAIETENYHLMYDVGKRYSHRFDVGEHIVSPYFQALGKDEVDVLVVSHGDSDHAGGVKGLLKKTAAKKVLAGQPDAPLLPSHLVAEQCKEGQYWYWDNAKFTILWPTQEFLDKQPMHKKSNNYSCVLLIDVEGQSILLAGDIESLVEYQLLASNSLLQNIDILLVPHHGSKTSSSEEWVSQLSPTWAIVSAGYLNPFKHPHSRVIKRYQNIETVIFNTANDGAIQATFRQGQWQWKRWRYDQRRYWYD